MFSTTSLLFYLVFFEVITTCHGPFLEQGPIFIPTMFKIIAGIIQSHYPCRTVS